MTLTTVLSNAGRSFIRMFVSALVIYAPGILSAPNLDQMRVLGVAALAASIAAGLRALQDFVPALQFPADWGLKGDMLGSFVRAFVGAFLVSAVGILDSPNLTEWKAAVTAALTGAITAGIVALQSYADKRSIPQAGENPSAPDVNR